MTVVIAFLVNILVAVAKTVAAVITSSASMLAEAVHSWSDALNEIFLLIADRRGARPKNERHPLGYGRSTFVWSLLAAFGIFVAGAMVSITHGVQQLGSAEPVEDAAVAYTVLGIAFVLEGLSFLQAAVRSNRRARERGASTWRFVIRTSDTTLRAVFFEDGAALIGLVIAAGSIGLHQLTGNANWDAVGSILIGVLLALVALTLIRRNMDFLIGTNVSDAVWTRVGSALLTTPQVARVTALHLEYVGPDRLLLIAAIDLDGDPAEPDVARKLRDIEQELEREDVIETAVVSLSVDDEPSLRFDGGRGIR